jgi:hypothetical protein
MTGIMPAFARWMQLEQALLQINLQENLRVQLLAQCVKELCFKMPLSIIHWPMKCKFVASPEI